jgi:hypothetical protein
MKMNYVITANHAGKSYTIQVENGKLVKRRMEYHKIPRGLVFSQYEDAKRIADYMHKKQRIAMRIEPLDAVIHRMEKDYARARLGL